MKIKLPIKYVSITIHPHDIVSPTVCYSGNDVVHCTLGEDEKEHVLFFNLSSELRNKIFSEVTESLGINMYE